MTPVLQGKSFDLAADFVKALNAERLAKPRSWITYVGRVQGHDVELKTYDTTHLQILRVDGIRHAPPMDMKPTAWKEFLLKALDRRSIAA